VTDYKVHPGPENQRRGFSENQEVKEDHQKGTSACRLGDMEKHTPGHRPILSREKLAKKIETTTGGPLLKDQIGGKKRPRRTRENLGDDEDHRAGE